MTENENRKWTLAEIHSAAVVHHIDTRGNTNDALDEAVGEAVAADTEGLLADPAPTGPELKAAWYRAKMQSNARASTDRFDRVISSGQSILDLGDDLDMVIVICSHKALRESGEAVAGSRSGRTTTLGRLTDDDLALVAIESRLNREAIDKADDAKQDVITAWRPRLSRYANYRQLRQREL